MLHEQKIEVTHFRKQPEILDVSQIGKRRFDFNFKNNTNCKTKIQIKMPMYKQWILSKDAPILRAKPKQAQKLCEKDFELVEDHTSDLNKGEILCRALFLSIDPITR